MENQSGKQDQNKGNGAGSTPVEAGFGDAWFGADLSFGEPFMTPEEKAAENEGKNTGAQQDSGFGKPDGQDNADRDSGKDAAVHRDPVQEAMASSHLKIDDYEQESIFLRDDEARRRPIETAGLDDPQQLMAALEAILFTMGDAVEISALTKALGRTEKEITGALDLLSEKYALPESGIMLQRFDNAVQMSTKPEQYGNLIKIASVPRKMQLSDSVIETLSIIAYKQPITKIEVENIRGVSCDYAINRLLEYDLIRELGRKEAPGRPILFGTTEQFLRSFGVKDLTQLPGLNTLKVEEFREEAEAEVDERIGV